MMHPRPSPIAASLYTLRDLNADVIIMHGPHGCCFRTGRLLESDGVRVVTTLTPSLSRSLPVLKQQPCGPCITITSAFKSLKVYKEAAIGLGRGCIIIKTYLSSNV